MTSQVCMLAYIHRFKYILHRFLLCTMQDTYAKKLPRRQLRIRLYKTTPVKKSFHRHVPNLRHYLKALSPTFTAGWLFQKKVQKATESRLKL